MSEPTRALVSARELSFYRFRFEVTRGADEGVVSTSDASEFSIGSSPANELVLSDPTVSRHHCAVTVTEDGFLLRDLGSKNGTIVNGSRILAAYLSPGAVVQLGETTLRFDRSDERVHEQLSETDHFGRAIGRSPAMRRIFALLPRIAASDATVLLEGETGTGKGLLAEAIHRASLRASKPLVVVDCGAIAPTLIESELFGHEKGAFTGADAARVGAFEAAQGGTVFLDELGELPLEMQPKLLRALEERAVKPIGGNDYVNLDVRVIAATNRDLREAINRGAFRSDLYYRLNTFRLFIPPLRQRRDDIAMLVEHFYRQFTQDTADPPAELVARLVSQELPGNVRELRGAVERALLVGDLDGWHEAPQVPSDDGPEPVLPDVHGAFDESLSFRAMKERAIARWERWYVMELTRRHDDNLSRAARAARMDRNHLRALLRKHRISADDE